MKIKEFLSRILKRKVSKEKHVTVENQDAVIWTTFSNLRGQGQNSGLGAVAYFDQRSKKQKA